MQSTEDCWMVVHPYSKYEKAEMSADLFIFLSSSIFIMKFFFFFKLLYTSILRKT